LILVDVNLLVYAHVAGSPQHSRARDWFDAQMNGPLRVGIPWPSLLGFLRLTSNPKVCERPLGMERGWLRRPNVRIPMPTDRHADVLEPLLAVTSGRANLVPDAHLAALALEHGLVLRSADADFARFPGLSWRNPLAD